MKNKISSTYFVITGKVTESNAKEIKTAFEKSKADRIHFVSYGKAGAKTVARLLDLEKWSYSKKAGICTLEEMQNRYKVLGHYECSEQVKPRTKKAFEPQLKTINYNELLNICKQANENIHFNLSHLPPERINNGIPILSYGDGKYYICKEETDCINVNTPNGKFKFYPSDNNYVWDSKEGHYLAPDKNHYLKVNLGKAINKLYCDVVCGSV